MKIVGVVFSSALILLGLIVQIAIQAENNTGDYVDHVANLKDALFKNKSIDTKRRPVLNYSSAVQVYVFLVILQVHDLDERTATLVVNGWGEFFWHDEQISWNPKDYGGLDVIEIPDRLIWKPDWAIMNNAELSTMFKYGQSLLYLHEDGHVAWLPGFTSKTTCPLDLLNFPFDQHICNIDIGSWTYSANQVNISTTPVHREAQTLERYKVPNSHWEVTELPTDINKIEFECCPGDEFPFVRHKLLLRRRSPLYKFTFVAPTLMCVFMTLALFWLPIATGNRFIISGVTIIIQMMILMGLAFSIPPGGTTIPQIVKFCGISFIMSCLSTIISIILAKISRKQSYIPLPVMIKNALTGAMGKIICFNVHNPQDEVNLSENKMEGCPDVSNNAQNNGMDIGKSLQSNDWILLAYAVNNICFILYCVSFIIVIFSSFL